MNGSGQHPIIDTLTNTSNKISHNGNPFTIPVLSQPGVVAVLVYRKPLLVDNSAHPSGYITYMSGRKLATRVDEMIFLARACTSRAAFSLGEHR